MFAPNVEFMRLAILFIGKAAIRAMNMVGKSGLATMFRLGGNVIVNPGINIGNNVVVGSGQRCYQGYPDNMLAAGNPCRVLREITDQDRKYYFQKPGI